MGGISKLEGDHRKKLTTISNLGFTGAGFKLFRISKPAWEGVGRPAYRLGEKSAMRGDEGINGDSGNYGQKKHTKSETTRKKKNTKRGDNRKKIFGGFLFIRLRGEGKKTNGGRKEEEVTKKRLGGLLCRGGGKFGPQGFKVTDEQKT